VIVEAPCNTPDAKILANVKLNATRAVPWMGSVAAHEEHAVIVGGGPSLAGSIDEIARRRDDGQTVFALNGAVEYLARHGIAADYQIVIDAREANQKFITNNGCRTRLLASQCHPSVFDRASALDSEGCGATVMFHMAMDGLPDALPKGRQVTQVCGLVTSGLTAMSVAYALGFRMLHLYGYDSSDADDGGAHAYPQEQTDAEQKRLDVNVDGKHFRCSFAMYKQAEQFPAFAQMLADNGATITVHGDGLLPTLARQMMVPETAAEAAA